MKAFALTVFCLILALPLRAETPVTQPDVVAAQYQATLAREEFQQVTTPDFVSQISHWILSALQSLQDSLNQYEYSSQLMRFSFALMWTILLLCIASLLYWVYKLFVLRRTFHDEAAGQPAGKPYFAPPETFEPEIRQAVTSRSWSMALRLSWRRFLALLERRELVIADRTRTNWEYIAQLQADRDLPAATRDLCRELARAYDLHIYGGQPLSDDDWAKWEAALQAITRTLRLEHVSPPAR